MSRVHCILDIWPWKKAGCKLSKLRHSELLSSKIVSLKCLVHIKHIQALHFKIACLLHGNTKIARIWDVRLSTLDDMWCWPATTMTGRQQMFIPSGKMIVFSTTSSSTQQASESVLAINFNGRRLLILSCFAHVAFYCKRMTPKLLPTLGFSFSLSSAPAHMAWIHLHLEPQWTPKHGKRPNPNPTEPVCLLRSWWSAMVSLSGADWIRSQGANAWLHEKWRQWMAMIC